MTNFEAELAGLKSSVARIEHAVCGRDGEPGLVRRVDRIEQRHSLLVRVVSALWAGFVWAISASWARGHQ